MTLPLSGPVTLTEGCAQPFCDLNGGPTASGPVWGAPRLLAELEPLFLGLRPHPHSAARLYPGGIRERERSLRVIRGPQRGPAGPAWGQPPKAAQRCALSFGMTPCLEPARLEPIQGGRRAGLSRAAGARPLALLPCPRPPFLGGGREVLGGQGSLSPPVPPQK